jgi:uncharacterized protein
MPSLFQIDLPPSGANVIRAYREGAIVVNEEMITQSLIVLPDRIILDWPPQSFEELTVHHFEAIAKLDPEIVLLGTGGRLSFPSDSLTAPLFEKQIGFEVMDTAAACRCYTVLAGEGRHVAAALFMIRSL